MNKLIVIAAILMGTLVLTACTSKNAKQLIGHAIADGANTQVAYNPSQCRTLRMQCVQGDYQEWETSEKEMGCSCKKL